MSEAISNWSGPYTMERAQALHALTRSIDPSFARQDEEFYKSRTVAQLRALRAQSWESTDGTGYMMASCYLATLEVAT